MFDNRGAVQLYLDKFQGSQRELYIGEGDIIGGDFTFVGGLPSVRSLVREGKSYKPRAHFKRGQYRYDSGGGVCGVNVGTTRMLKTRNERVFWRSKS